MMSSFATNSIWWLLTAMFWLNLFTAMRAREQNLAFRAQSKGAGS